MSIERTIGVLTSGGDAPGMNAAIRAVVRTGLYNNVKIMGVRRGYTGLICGDMYEMNLRSVRDIIHRGGTILYSSRCPEFLKDEGIAKAKRICDEAGIDGLIVIGGDGSFRGAAELSKKGIPCVGIPGTIDNDITASDYTIGFDTAVNTAVEMVDKIRDTSQSHDRCSVVEVMGRHSGNIALQTGIACGASSIIIPEITCDIERDVANKIIKSLRTGKQHFVVVVAEGAGDAKAIAEKIQQSVGIDTRLTVLGYVQRGGSPTAKDRAIASQMGHYAVELLLQKNQSRVVVVKNGIVTDFDIDEGTKKGRTFDFNLYRTANEISI